MPPLTLTPDELAALTGYRQAAKQLEALLSRGFWRATINAAGRVIVERSHYEAITRGEVSAPKPKMIIPRRLAA